MPSRILPQALLAAAAPCLVLAGCESPEGQALVLNAPTPLAGSTYAWAPNAQPGSGDPRVDNAILRERIKIAVDTNLAAKGYMQVAPSKAKLLVAYHIGLHNRIEGAGASNAAACGRRGCIGGYGWGMYGAPMDVDVRSITYTEGALMLDLVNAASGKLALRATSHKRVDQKSTTQDDLNDIVADMVKTLPPGGWRPTPDA
jgi:hypothetical protein